jgi:hypothetical protein
VQAAGEEVAGLDHLATRYDTVSAGGEMITDDKRYVYRLSLWPFTAGEYSDRRELWWVHSKNLSEQEIASVLREKIGEASEIAKCYEDAKWNEAERLFGERKWPYNGGMRSPKGTEAQFIAWRDKWEPFSWPMSQYEIAWELAGFEPLQPDFQKDCDYISDQIRDWCLSEDDLGE